MGKQANKHRVDLKRDRRDNIKMSGELIEREEGIEVESHFIRDRNVLLTRAEFSSFYVDYYLHLADMHLKYAPDLDQMFKELLAALILHGASRPWNEKYAWTLNFQEPRANPFVAGDNTSGTAVGTIFTDNVKESDTNLMFAKVIRGNQPKRRSVIDFKESDLFPAVEAFYRQSEQRICRYFQVDDEEYWFLTAQPDCDEAWLLGLEQSDLATLEKKKNSVYWKNVKCAGNAAVMKRGCLRCSCLPLSRIKKRCSKGKIR